MRAYRIHYLCENKFQESFKTWQGLQGGVLCLSMAPVTFRMCFSRKSLPEISKHWLFRSLRILLRKALRGDSAVLGASGVSRYGKLRTLSPEHLITPVYLFVPWQHSYFKQRQIKYFILRVTWVARKQSLKKVTWIFKKQECEELWKETLDHL